MVNVEELLKSVDAKIQDLNVAMLDESINRVASAYKYRDALNEELFEVKDKIKELTKRNACLLLRGLKALSSRINDVEYKPQYDAQIDNIVANEINKSLDVVVDGINRRVKLFRDYDIALNMMGITERSFYGENGSEIRKNDQEKVRNLEQARNGLLRQKETIARTLDTKGVDKFINDIKENFDIISLDDNRTILPASGMDPTLIDIYNKQKGEEKIEKRLTLKDIDAVVELRNIEKGVKLDIKKERNSQKGKDMGCIIS
ncbi:MAG: hypothetical protein J6Y29_06975 [Clostridiales bacterium]|nr:hypothetical protein [Clostridiales bacterium]